MSNKVLFLLLISFGCTYKVSDQEIRTLDFGPFTIDAPSAWKKINLQGIDSYVGRITVDSSDTLHFDIGTYSNTLTEPRPPIIDSFSLQYMTGKFDPSDYIIVKNHRDVDEDKYRKQNIYWDTIDGYIAKIVQPIRSGTGITGIYIDSLWIQRSDLQRFNLYGQNLKSKNEVALLQALRTLQFKRPK